MINCDLSDTIIASTAQFAPSGLLLVSASGCKVTVRDVATLEVIQVFQCIDKPDKVEFSPDSSYLSCAFLSRGAIQCFSMANPEWKCRINEGVSGFINVHWMPDSRGIVTVSDFGIQVTIWSLLDSSSSVISSPKQGLGFIGPSGASQQQLLAFSDCSRYLAIVHRQELHDFIGIYSTSPFQELSKFKSRSNDVAAIYWTHNGTHVVTVDSPLTYKIVIYSASGEMSASFEAYQHALGVRSLSFYRPPISMSPSLSSDAFSSEQLMAVGSYDGKVRLLSMRSWQAAFVLPLVHPREMDIGMCGDDTGSYPMITLEVPMGSDGEAVSDLSTVLGTTQGQAGTVFDMTKRQNATARVSSPRTYVTRRSNTIKALPHIQPDVRNSKFLPPEQGVSWHSRSHCGALLAARESSYPRCLWIWSTLEAKLQAIVVQMDTITCAQWRPQIIDNQDGNQNGTNLEGNLMQPLLAFSTGSSRIYFWSPLDGHLEGQIRYSDLQSCSSSSSFSMSTSFSSTTTSATKLANTSNQQKPLGVTHLLWSKDGKRMLLKGKESYLICEVPTDTTDIM